MKQSLGKLRLPANFLDRLAAESFENVPDNRRVQMAWGRIEDKQMGFSQMFLFPTEFRLVTTGAGVRLLASPVKEIDLLHGHPGASHKSSGVHWIV